MFLGISNFKIDNKMKPIIVSFRNLSIQLSVLNLLNCSACFLQNIQDTSITVLPNRLSALLSSEIGLISSLTLSWTAQVQNATKYRNLLHRIKFSPLLVCPIVHITMETEYTEENQLDRNKELSSVIESTSYGYSENVFFLISIKTPDKSDKWNPGKFLTLVKKDGDGDIFEELPLFHAIIAILRVIHADSWRIGIFCYFCDGVDRIVYSAENARDLVSLFKLSKEINTGNGSPMQLYSTTEGENCKISVLKVLKVVVVIFWACTLNKIALQIIHMEKFIHITTTRIS